MNRRDFLRLGSAFAGTTLIGSSLWQEALAAIGGPAQGGASPYGPLQPPDANGLRLPAGFTSRILAFGMQEVPGTGHVWHAFADGGDTFRTPGGWIYVSNSEFVRPFAGVGALRFDHRGEIVDAYSICGDTFLNCAGGATPWGTWLTCEEYPDGLVWECDPEGVAAHVPRSALGTFKHEAAAVDPFDRCLYLTEDEDDGCFYRFTPDVWTDLSSGLLEVAEVDANDQVVWHEVPDPNPDTLADPTRGQVPDATAFDGGEGIVWSGGHVYFTTKGDNRVWDYHPASGLLCILYEADLDPQRRLVGVDNITANRWGDLVVAEDPGNSSDLELVLITPNGVASPLVRIEGQQGSEITGPAFDPWERRLYFSSQRGGPGLWGITYEVTGPFRRLAGC